MQTVRQIERYWSGRHFDRLAKDLLAARPEASPRLQAHVARPIPAAALALIRLDELGQAWHPLNQKLIQTLLSAQEADGGWGDPITTALVLRALLLNSGQGVAIDRGLAWLADLQKSCGAWPATPVRRTAEDPFTTAFILFSLGHHPAFTAAVRLDDATAWMTASADHFDPDTRRLWARTQSRLRLSQLVAVN